MRSLRRSVAATGDTVHDLLHSFVRPPTLSGSRFVNFPSIASHTYLPLGGLQAVFPSLAVPSPEDTRRHGPAAYNLSHPPTQWRTVQRVLRVEPRPCDIQETDASPADGTWTQQLEGLMET